jgi:hypothetical protein
MNGPQEHAFITLKSFLHLKSSLDNFEFTQVTQDRDRADGEFRALIKGNINVITMLKRKPEVLRNVVSLHAEKQRNENVGTCFHFVLALVISVLRHKD